MFKSDGLMVVKRYIFNRFCRHILCFLICSMLKYYYNKRGNMVNTSRPMISYKKLWKLLIDKDMGKNDLQAKANICRSTVSKLNKNQNVNTDILVRICVALDCDISDISEIIYGR